jgi:hypothetical protein
MYQVTKREKGQCFFGCAGEVTNLTKEGQTIKVCRSCLWKALGNGERKPKAEKNEQKK